MAWWLNYCVIDFSWKYRLSGMLGAWMFNQNVHTHLWLWWERLLQWMPSEMWTMWRKIWSRCYKNVQWGMQKQRYNLSYLYFGKVYDCSVFKPLFYYTGRKNGQNNAWPPFGPPQSFSSPPLNNPWISLRERFVVCYFWYSHIQSKPSRIWENCMTNIKKCCFDSYDWIFKKEPISLLPIFSKF